MAAVLARTEYPDNFDWKHFLIAAPAIVNPLFVADGQWVIDAIRIRFGTKSSVSGAIGWLQKHSDGVITTAAVAISSATWDNTAKTLTKTGAFAGYTWREGDVINVTSSSATGFVAGRYRVASKTSNDAIVLTTLAGVAISWTGTLNDVAATFNPGVVVSGNALIANPSSSTAVAGIAVDGIANTYLDGTILVGDPADPVPSLAKIGTDRNYIADKEGVSFVCDQTPTALANLQISLRLRNRRR